MIPVAPMTFAYGKIVSTLLASWMLVGCLLCSCLHAATASASTVKLTPTASGDHACCAAGQPTVPPTPPCHPSQSDDDSGCADCPAMKSKALVAKGDQGISNLLLAPWLVATPSFISPQPSNGSLVTSVDLATAPPHPLATPVQMKCVLVL
jgi:hypothetical protein